MVYLHSIIAFAIMLLNNNKRKTPNLIHFNISFNLYWDHKTWEEWGSRAVSKILTTISSAPHNPQSVSDKV